MGSAPKIPPPPQITVPPFPEMPEFEFPEFPAFTPPPMPPMYDPEAVERKKEKARQEELQSVIARKGRGREGTVKTGALGLNDESQPVRRPGLLAKY